jgi:hypothetical protein
VSGSTKQRYCKLLHDITNHDLLLFTRHHNNEEAEEEEVEEDRTSLTFGQLEQASNSLLKTCLLHKHFVESNPQKKSFESTTLPFFKNTIYAVSKYKSPSN